MASGDLPDLNGARRYWGRHQSAASVMACGCGDTCAGIQLGVPISDAMLNIGRWRILGVLMFLPGALVLSFAATGISRAASGWGALPEARAIKRGPRRAAGPPGRHS